METRTLSDAKVIAAANDIFVTAFRAPSRPAGFYGSADVSFWLIQG